MQYLPLLISLLCRILPPMKRPSILLWPNPRTWLGGRNSYPLSFLVLPCRMSISHRCPLLSFSHFSLHSLYIASNIYIQLCHISSYILDFPTLVLNMWIDNLRQLQKNHDACHRLKILLLFFTGLGGWPGNTYRQIKDTASFESSAVKFWAL